MIAVVALGLVVIGVGLKVLSILGRSRATELRVSNAWLDEHVRGRRP